MACALATALGVIFTRPATVGTVAYAMSEEHALPKADGEKDSDAVSLADKEALAELVDLLGVDAELITFYARSCGGTESQLLEAFKEDQITITSAFSDFIDGYSNGELVYEDEHEHVCEEDWYLSPDEVSTYATSNWSAVRIGLQDSWLNYYSSKAGGITTESQYYRNSNFTMGYYVKWDNSIYSDFNYVMRRREHSYMLYNIVWLEEGESYTFGLRNTMAMNSVYASIATSQAFLTDDHYVYKYFFSNVATNPDPITTVEPDTSRNKMSDYLSEFYSNINPATTDYSTSFSAAANSNLRMTVKPDAPSGAYMIVLRTVANGNSEGSGTRFSAWNYGSTSGNICKNACTANGDGQKSYSAWCTYATLVCRKGITKPELEYGDGVTADLLSKTVSFNNTDHELIIKNDWGAGLESFVISEWDEATSSWISWARNTNSTNVTLSSRGTRGSITKAGLLKFKAKNAGKYRVEITPFKNWGNDENDRAPVVFNFTIKPQELETPLLINETGVDQANNYKFANETGNTLYVSIYPAPSTWTSYTQSGPFTLGEFTWSTNGVLTLSQENQGEYYITINLKYNTALSGGGTQINQMWDDGTTGSKVFKFEIGPMKIPVPDIIKDSDTGQITTYEKIVTFNGADQTLSFMPVDTNQLIFNLTAYDISTGEEIDVASTSSMMTIKDSTLTFTAFDAGEYWLTVTVNPRYIFDTNDTSRNYTIIYKLIIHEMEITAPIFELRDTTTKTVTYGGEKFFDGPNKGEDWVATITFTNCDESRIEWKSTTLSQQYWRDSALVLAGRSAKTYEVTFETKKNYKWKSGITVPTYSLVINKLQIAKPNFVKDNEAGAEYNYKGADKWIMFEAGVEHNFILQFDTAKNLDNIIYTKSSSIEFSYNGNFGREWFQDKDKNDQVRFYTEAAGTYTFEVYPTQNYCWYNADPNAPEDTSTIKFVFIIQPIALECLELWGPDPYGGSNLTQYYWNSYGNYEWNEKGGYWINVSYDGTAKTVRIGHNSPVSDAQRYITDENNTFAKSFYILDKNGAIISVGNNDPDKLLKDYGITCNEDGGFLTLTFTNAGIFRVQVFLKSTDYWWARTNSSTVEYTVTVTPEAVVAPEILQNECEGYDLNNKFTATIMHGTYYNTNFVMALNFASVRHNDYDSSVNYSKIVQVDYITYTDDIQDGKRVGGIKQDISFSFIESMNDATAKGNALEALKHQNGTYVSWIGDRMSFYAKDYGEYVFSVTLTNSNYAWKGYDSDVRTIEFKIIIDRAPVSGLEMWYLGDEADQKVNSSGQRVGPTDIMGSYSQSVGYDGAIFSEDFKELWFTRTSTKDLVDTGFNVQYGYTVDMVAWDSSYVMDPDKTIRVASGDFNKDGLKIGFLDAGTYTITIYLTYNYRWKENPQDGSESIGELTFTLTIQKCPIAKPNILDNLGNDTITSGSKVVDYERKYLSLELGLKTFPNGYKIESFEYTSLDRADREAQGDLMRVYKDVTDSTVAGVKIGVVPEDNLLRVQAQSAGEYMLIIVVSVSNNYRFSDNASEYPYRFVINKAAVDLPDAYLKLAAVGDLSSLVEDLSLVESNAPKPDGSNSDISEAFDIQSENTKTVGYDGAYHLVYIHGDSVKGGYFNISVELPAGNNNGLSTMDTKPDPTDTTDSLTSRGYFRLAAMGVNTYTIVLKFVSNDFFWRGDISSGSATRSFKFVITRKLVEVPKIVGYSNLTLDNNTYKVEFEYINGAGGNRMITLQDVELGISSGSVIKATINSASQTNGYVIMDEKHYDPSVTDPSSTYGFASSFFGNSNYGYITMSTALSNILAKGQVPHTYIIDLDIDPYNMRWNTSGEGDIATKHYQIEIVKQQIERPYIIDTVNSTKNNKYVTYTGEDWGDALQIALMDINTLANMDGPNITVTYSHASDTSSTNGYMISDFKSSHTVNGKTYENLLSVSTSAPADTYMVTAKLTDPANTEWADSLDADPIEDIELCLVVEPMKVDKPSIYLDGKTEAQMGVVGLTRTVTYENDPSLITHEIKITGYWANLADGISGTNIPDIMTWEYADNTLPMSKAYDANQFSGSGFNPYNNGLLIFSASQANAYIIVFKLTKNAVWIDSTNDYVSRGDIEITLKINKKQHPDLFILENPIDGSDSLIGNTLTYTYALDEHGDPIERFMQIENYNNNLMYFSGVKNGIESTINGDGYLEYTDTGLGIVNSGKSYLVKAYKAGEYEIEFTLSDWANHRWDFADSETCTFKLVIKKLVLSQPVINSEYSLTNETVDGHTLSVDYDRRLHSILVQSLFEKLENGYYYDSGNGLGEKYFKVENDTTAKNRALDSTYNPLTHPTYDKEYDTTSSMKIKDLFEESTDVFTTDILNPSYVYPGTSANLTSSFINLFRLTAYTPGDYYLTFTLTDPDNMVWANSTDTSIEYKLIINKVRHDAPTEANGTATSLEYTGDKVEFTLKNVYNGVSVAGGPVESTVSEEYEVISYSGPRSDVAANLATTNFEVSWFNGNLTLGFTEIGTYTVKVSITDTNYIAWNGTTDTSKSFTFTVTKRTVNASVQFSAQGDPELDAKLQEGKNVWPITVEGYGVDAQIVFSGLRDVPTASTWDQRLEFKIYYENVADGIAKNTQTFADTDTPIMWTIIPQNGTYSLIIWYSGIDNGKGNIIKGKYNLVVEQIDTDGNHLIPLTKFAFEVEADPAPFKKDMLEWVYTRSDDLSVNYYPITQLGLGQAPDNRFVLEYEEGVSYTFHARLNAEGQKGFDGSYPATFLAQLNSWFVDWNGSYDGIRTVSSAITNQVSIKITALNPDEYSFNEPDFVMYYTIAKAKYDLSNLEWNYDGTTPFTYDGTNKSVAIVPKSGTSMPAGLTMGTYKTSGNYVSGSNSGSVGPSNTNKMIYAGEYVTTASFTVATNSNYEQPVMSNPDSYLGTFEWTRSWTINPQHIVVDWVQGHTVTNDGTTIQISRPAVAGAHAGKFAFIYEVEDSTQPSGWRTVSGITRTPGDVVKYRATAYLISGSNATDYARNYTFEFVGKDNPLEFEVGGDDTVIYNHITVNDEIKTDYEYTGSAVVALPVIDMDTSNGQITVDNIIVQYYRRDPVTNDKTGSPISAPVEVGNYIVVLKLWYTNSSEAYALSVETYIFNIVKAKLKSSEFEWHVKHNDGTNTIEARYDTSIGGRWVDIVTGEEVILDYDGRPYEIVLKTTYPASVISFTMFNASQINAGGPYVATAVDSKDDAHYEFNPADPVALSFSWYIEKHYLDLKDIAWNYEEPFVFTVVNGAPKAFAAVIENLPEYLKDKVIYSTLRGTELMSGDITNQGDYKTTVAIVEELIDKNNYDLGSWPVAVFKTIEWKINRREIQVPENDNSWAEFDGVQHNLLKSFGFDVDWAEYFTVDVTYASLDGGGETAYDGSQKYGGKYYAYDAGTYKFTLKIKPEWNADASINNNVVWVVTSNSVTTKTPNDRTVSYTVHKKQLVVTGWMRNYEASHVILAGNLDSSKFVDYNFYSGNVGSAGAPATLNDILNSAGGDTFSMVPVVRSAYSGNITLSFESGTEFISFVTPEITEENATPVNGKPYIYGYMVKGVINYFSNEQLASGDLYVIYTGEPITFIIRDWDSYYSKYVTVLNGSLDDLTQTEAGKYPLTLILRNDLEKPLYWGKTDDNKIDRSAVVLEFEIRFRMLTVPTLPAEVDYTGSEIDILSKITNTSLVKLMAEYGDYVTITGNTATNVNESGYILYLTIKEEYSYAVRWNVDGYENGIIGTYSFVWHILPILIQKPEQDFNVTIEYDGTAHSVFEVLKGYDAISPTIEITRLMEFINVVNGHAINADTYYAVLSLPNENYAWKDGTGNIIAGDRSSITIEWTINKSIVDFSKAYWGYLDGDEEKAYDDDHPFVFTVENGQIKNYTVQIFGLPDILKFYTVYRMNGQEGINYAGTVGSHTTSVQFNLQLLDTKNFVVGEIPSSISQLVWRIVPREFNLPYFDGSWTVFDGKVHDLADLLGLSEDWAEYLNISVEYKETESEVFAPYNGENSFAVDYSNYNGFYYGFYRITVTLKNDGTVLISTGINYNIAWAGDEAPSPITIEVAELTLTVTEWNEENEYSAVIFEGGELSDEIADKFEYVIYADGDLDKKPLKPEDIVGGQTYYILFKFKDGSNEKGVKYSYGIILEFAEGVPNPLEFGSYSYGNQPIVWVPAPMLETAALEYNGRPLTFAIKDADTLYKLTTSQRLILNTMYQLGLDNSVTSYIYLQNANSLTATAAGSYTAVVRLLSKVRLSWYDSNIYAVDPSGNLVYKDTGVFVDDAESLFNNKSYTLTYRITPKKVPVLTEEDLELLMNLIVRYNGYEQDVTKSGFRSDDPDIKASTLFAELEAKYGKIFDYAGNRATEAGDYEMTITLADLDSCYWYAGEPKEEKHINIEGYVFRYILSGNSWKIVLVKADADGNAVKDSAGNYIEYNEGEYKLDVAYMPEFETEYVTIGEGPQSLLNADGTVSEWGKYWWVNGELYPSGADETTAIRLTYIMSKDDPTKPVRYKLESGNYVEDAEGEYVQIIKLDTGADAKYGYKVPKMGDATEYTYLYGQLPTDNNDGTPIAITDSNGAYIDTYLFKNGSTYELRKYELEANGYFKPDGSGHYLFTLVESVCQMVDLSTYTYKNGKYEVDLSGGGSYMLRYVLEAGSSNRKQTIVYAKDENGNYIVDAEHTVVTKFVYESVTDIEYKIKWKIDQETLSAPVFNVSKMPYYTGKTIKAEDVLDGFIPGLMKIVEHGEEINADTYVAKIIITNENSKWDPSASIEDYVLVSWTIAKAEVDVSKIEWVYTDGTNTYKDDSSFVYTRVNGEPVVYWVEIANLPEVLKSKVVYTTNNKPGAYAGTDAGIYNTSVEFLDDPNILAYDLPETFADYVSWSIKRRVLEVPHGSVQMIFDSEEHDLLEILGVPDDWNEYYDIKVEYAFNFVDFVAYDGHDGKKYEAFGSGAYKFTISIKAEVNATNTNVVWHKETDVPDTPEQGDPTTPDTPEQEDPTTPDNETPGTENENTGESGLEEPTESAGYGLKSFRKYA